MVFCFIFGFFVRASRFQRDVFIGGVTYCAVPFFVVCFTGASAGRRHLRTACFLRFARNKGQRASLCFQFEICGCWQGGHGDVKLLVKMRNRWSGVASLLFVPDHRSWPGKVQSNHRRLRFGQTGRWPRATFSCHQPSLCRQIPTTWGHISSNLGSSVVWRTIHYFMMFHNITYVTYLTISEWKYHKQEE